VFIIGASSLPHAIFATTVEFLITVFSDIILLETVVKHMLIAMLPVSTGLKRYLYEFHHSFEVLETPSAA